MKFSIALVAAAGSLFLMASDRACAKPVVEIFTEAEVGADIGLSFLETVTSDGTIAYATLRDTTSAFVGGIVAYDGSTFTTLMDPVDWAATTPAFDYAAGNGVAVVGGVQRAVSFFDNNVYDVDLGTGAVTEVVTKAAIDAVSGTSSNLSAVFEVTPDGTIYSVESVSDQLLVISPANTVAIEMDATEFADAIGGTSIGGIGVDGDTVYLGSNSDDQLVAWDTVNDVASVVLTEAQIEAVTDDIDGTAGFGDIFAAPDGLIYFYESDSDYLLSFDPADPVGTLTAVVTEAEFNDGPSSDTINQLTWYQGRIAFTDGGIGFYQVVPEPMSGALAGGLLSLFAVARRRR